MKHKIFSVYDSKAEAYLQPFTMSTIGLAIRSFTDTVNDKNSVISKHPEDYILFELGEFSDLDAKFEMLSAPKSLGVATQFINVNPLVNDPVANLESVV